MSNLYKKKSTTIKANIEADCTGGIKYLNLYFDTERQLRNFMHKLNTELLDGNRHAIEEVLVTKYKSTAWNAARTYKMRL